jgi:hypothetical protein
MERNLIPVACTLTDTAATAQAVEWTDLVEQAINTERVDGGAVLTFDPDLQARVQDLADREALCCAFLTITTERTEQGFRLEITAPDPEAHSLIESMVGLTSR